MGDTRNKVTGDSNMFSGGNSVGGHQTQYYNNQVHLHVCDVQATVILASAGVLLMICTQLEHFPLPDVGDILFPLGGAVFLIGTGALLVLLIKSHQARRRAGGIMEQGKEVAGYTPSCTAELQECVMLVKEGFVTEITDIKFDNIDLREVTSQDLKLLLNVVTRYVGLHDLTLSESQTEAVFSSMSRLCGGVMLWNRVDIEVTAATEALRKIRRVRGDHIQCWADSRDKYSQGMEEWAGVLGWRYRDEETHSDIRRE